MTRSSRRARQPLQGVARSFLDRREAARVLVLAGLGDDGDVVMARGALLRAADALSLPVIVDSVRTGAQSAAGPGLHLVELGALDPSRTAALVPPLAGAGADVLLVCLPPVLTLSVRYRLSLWVWSLHPRFVRCLGPGSRAASRSMTGVLKETLALTLDDPPPLEVLSADRAAHGTLMQRVLQSLVAASARGARTGARGLQGRA